MLTWFSGVCFAVKRFVLECDCCGNRGTCRPGGSSSGQCGGTRWKTMSSTPKERLLHLHPFGLSDGPRRTLTDRRRLNTRQTAIISISIFDSSFHHHNRTHMRPFVSRVFELQVVGFRDLSLRMLVVEVFSKV